MVVATVDADRAELPEGEAPSLGEIEGDRALAVGEALRETDIPNEIDGVEDGTVEPLGEGVVESEGSVDAVAAALELWLGDSEGSAVADAAEDEDAAAEALDAGDTASVRVAEADSEALGEGATEAVARGVADCDVDAELERLWAVAETEATKPVEGVVDDETSPEGLVDQEAVAVRVAALDWVGDAPGLPEADTDEAALALAESVARVLVEADCD